MNHALGAASLVRRLSWIGIIRQLCPKTTTDNRPTKAPSRANFLAPARRVRGCFSHGFLAPACEVIGIGCALITSTVSSPEATHYAFPSFPSTFYFALPSLVGFLLCQHCQRHHTPLDSTLSSDIAAWHTNSHPAIPQCLPTFRDGVHRPTYCLMAVYFAFCLLFFATRTRRVSF